MNGYTIKCTEEQTKKAFELGAPIKANKDYSNGNISETLCVYGEIVDKNEYGIGECIILVIPTAEQMIGWLRSKNVLFHFDDETNYWNICSTGDDLTPLRLFGYAVNKELDAIDAALEYLGNLK